MATKHIHIHVGGKTKDASAEVPSRIDKVIRELQGWVSDMESLKRTYEDDDVTVQDVEKYLSFVKSARGRQIG